MTIVAKPHRKRATSAEDPYQDDPVACESSLDVIARARDGEPIAARVLLERTVGPLRDWARRRLPDYARGGANTEDIVQDVVLRALGRIDQFEHRTVDGLQAYLRESVRNRIRDEIRRVSLRGVPAEIHEEEVTDTTQSPLEALILRERSEKYIAALRTLRPEDRLAIIFRLEHRWSLQVIANKLGKPTPDAARMAVVRAMKRLAEAMGLAQPE